MNDNRPVNLDLMTIKFPVTAIVSILHRISGVAIFVALPILLWMLGHSLSSPQGFAETLSLLEQPLVKFVIWAVFAALIYHLVAGIRHLFMDMDIGESLEGGRRGAVIVFVVSAVLILLAGGWIW